MGLFGKRNKEPKEPIKCDVCGNMTTGVIWSAKDGTVCHDCIKSAKIGTTPTFFKTFEINQIKDIFDRKRIKRTMNFEQIGPLLVNASEKYWAFQNTPSPIGVSAAQIMDTFWLLESPLFRFDEVEGIKVLLNGQVGQIVGCPSDVIVPASKKAQIQMFITVGGYTNKTYMLLLQDSSSYYTFLKLFCEMMKVDTPDPVIKESIPIADAIGKAVAENLRNSSSQGDVTEELRNFKALLDEGIITQEEFEAKKKQLLGI